MAGLQYCLDGFLLAKKLERVSDYTLRTYRERLSQFAQHIGEKEVAELTTADVRSWLAERHERVSTATQHTDLRIVRTFLNWLRAEGLVTGNCAERVKLGRLPQSIIPTFSREDIEGLLTLCPTNTFLGTRNRLLVLLLLDTGMRIGEAQRLTWSDVEQDLIRVQGKGSKQRWVRIGSVTQKALWHYGVYRNGYDSLWLSEERQPMTLGGLKLTVFKLCRRAGLKGPRRSAHTFRHTFAVNWLRNGGGEFVLQQLLGHSTLAMTRRYVQSLNAEDAALAHTKYSPVDNLFGAANARGNGREPQKAPQ